MHSQESAYYCYCLDEQRIVKNMSYEGFGKLLEGTAFNQLRAI